MLESENKKGNWLLIVIVILLVSLICVCGLLAFKMYQNESSSNSNIDNVQDENNGEDVEKDENIVDDEPVVTDLSLESTIVKSLSNVFYGKYKTTEMSNYDNYFYRQDKTIISDLPIDLKIIMSFRYLNNPDIVSRIELRMHIDKFLELK